MTRVVVLDDYQGVALSSADWAPVLARAEVDVVRDHLGSESAVVERLRGAQVVVAMRERTAFPASLFARLPDLGLLVTTGMGNASVDLAAAAAAGVTVCGTGMSAAGTPELTWALLLALVRHVAVEDANLRAGRWQTTIGTELAGRTLGLLGLGRIGQRVARYAHAFDMPVIAWSQNLTAATAAEHGARLVDRAELFKVSDVVSVHLKLSARTRGLVGAAELASLGPRGLLVNTSRGPIVDESELLAALRDGTLGGAALDVYDAEPLPAAHPLRSAPRTVLTPHIGYVTREAYSAAYSDAVEDIAGWLSGSPVRVL